MLAILATLFFILNIPSASNAAGDDETFGFKESLRECLKNNFDLKISESTVLEKEGSFLKSNGEFDFSFSGSYTSDHSETPSSSSLDGVSSAVVSDTQTYKGEVKKKLGLLGTDISLPYSYAASTSNSSYSRIPEGHNTTLSFSVTQPLLKVWSWGYYYRNLDKAEFDWQAAKERYGEQLDKTLQKSIELYLNTLREMETFRVKEYSLKVALDLMKAAEAKEKAGRASYVEKLEAKGRMEKARDAMLAAQTAMEERKNELAQHIFGDPLRTFEIKDELETLETAPEKTEVEIHVKKAMENRPEAKLAKINSKIAKLDMDSASADRLPTLNFEGKQTYKGLAANFNESQSQIETQKYPSQSVGVKLEMPLFMYAARGEHQIKRLKKQQDELKAQNILRNIRMDVVKFHRQVATNWERTRALKEALSAETEKASGQIRRYEQGRISIFELNQSLQDKEIAQLEYLKARVNYIRARYDFFMSQGTLVSDLGL